LLPTPSGPLEISDPAVISINQHQRPAAAVTLSVVIPTFNEAMNVEPLVERIDRILSSAISNDYEIIVVDDNSPDGTWQVAQSLIALYPNLRVMRRTCERGLSTAVIRGWQSARGTVLGVIDGDLQHPPEVLLPLLKRIQAGTDIAIASRNVEGGGVSDWSFARRILSRGAQILGLVLLPEVIGRVSDPMSGFFLVRRSALIGRRLDPVGYKILVEVLGRGQISAIGEVGYVFQERESGGSKVTWRQYVAYVRHLLRLRVAQLAQSRFIRFGTVGLSGVAVDMSLFYLIRHFANLPTGLSGAISAEVAMFNNFAWNEVWTFNDLSMAQPGARQRMKRLLKFNLICLAGLVFHLAILLLLAGVFHVNEYAAKAVAIAVATGWNYWINSRLNWRVTDVRTAA
jgi:dolichol-phosphate mannosyltransferase